MSASMDTLDGSSWDVVIAGTGLQPALLALALSRSDQKVLHLDSNDYYGGREAALSIPEFETWVDKTNRCGSASPCANASIDKHDSDGRTGLTSTRGYSLSLTPTLLYTRSALLTALVSSKAHEQLEFLAVGNWFVHQASAGVDDASNEYGLLRVPNGREDIFSSPALSLRAKSALVRFLRFVVAYQDEENQETLATWNDEPFADFLTKKFKIQEEYHGPLFALSMSSEPDAKVITQSALASIHRHLTSMGIFGAGFSAVLPKYGGLSEVIQVACRAAAVGGTVYVLNRSIQRIGSDPKGTKEPSIQIQLEGEETVTTRHFINTSYQLPAPDETPVEEGTLYSRSISVVDSRLTLLFPAGPEGSPPPSAAVVVYPSGSVTLTEGSTSNDHPIHLLVHSADTGECPQGKCIVYAMTAQGLSVSSAFLDRAVGHLLASVQEDPLPSVAWSVEYEARTPSTGPAVIVNEQLTGLHRFVEAPSHPVFDDRVIDTVRQAWHTITGESEETFLHFGDRNVEPDEDALDT
ncbi:hypothetical protein CAC42_2048 [Sphaceloma murrayae]|uniref:Rab proteins geranylgeranyltransferase n=1 Tax=Sphaceloma murrayae TaxID=2082308 RepID=A0A2K1QIU9_9PEZI|nr:hypothetical protein CAC42_2048 [Sphaceloma murrayae]